MNLYEAVSVRKSIRKYKKEKAEDRVLAQIENFVKKAAPLDPEIRTDSVILDRNRNHTELRGFWKVEAPYYLVFYSEEKPGYLRNAGYILEQIVLYLVTKGIGSCYLGASKALIPEKEGMRQVLVLAFGYAEGILYREPAKAKRLSFKDLCIFKEEADESMKVILRAARLSPSSLNSQPWRFIVYHDCIHVFMCREFFQGRLLPSVREVDMGIMLSHIMLAAEELWLAAEWKFDDMLKKKVYKNGDYIGTVYLR